MLIITGAAGFIGCNIAKRLNELGFTDLVLVDKQSTQMGVPNLEQLQYKDYLPKQDLLNYLTQSDKIEAIFHLGACSSTTETNVEYLKQNNFEYTKNLALWNKL